MRGARISTSSTLLAPSMCKMLHVVLHLNIFSAHRYVLPGSPHLCNRRASRLILSRHSETGMTANLSDSAIRSGDSSWLARIRTGIVPASVFTPERVDGLSAPFPRVGYPRWTPDPTRLFLPPPRERQAHATPTTPRVARSSEAAAATTGNAAQRSLGVLAADLAIRAWRAVGPPVAKGEDQQSRSAKAQTRKESGGPFRVDRRRSRPCRRSFRRPSKSPGSLLFLTHLPRHLETS